MNRRNRILAGVLAVQLVIAVVVFVPRVLPSQSAAAPLLGTLQVADVAGLAIQEQGGKRVDLVKKNGAWVLPAGDDYAASPDKVAAFVEKLIGLKTDPLVTRTANSHARLQVSDTTYVRKVDLTLADGGVTSLFLGSASGGATHLRLDGHDEVYLARGLNSFEASTDMASWIDATYVSVPQDQILSATIENAQGKFEFAKDAQDQWTLKGLTADQAFNPDSVVTMMARLSSITMVKPLGKTAKPEYGLDKPTATVTVILSDTASTRVTTLKIGMKDADGNYPMISSDSTYYVSVAGFNVDGYVTAKLDTFLVVPTPTSMVVPTIEPVAIPTLIATEPVTSTPPVTATVPLTATTTP
ncbi:MAG: DUF4340 domain-containing protein [Chloroflexi bacterium]|nr:DUF4340 domain-containing protein [Chloroflexota bacterium]